VPPAVNLLPAPALCHFVRKSEVHELLDRESVRAAQERLVTAVDAERVVELRKHTAKMDSTRTGLEATGLMIPGLVFEVVRCVFLLARGLWYWWV
jgi:hypothetical protein